MCCTGAHLLPNIGKLNTCLLYTSCHHRHGLPALCPDGGLYHCQPQPAAGGCGCRRLRYGPVSYTHLDVYKRQALTNVFICVALGAGVGAGVLVSRYFGAKEYGKMKTIVSTSLLSFLILSIVLGVFGLEKSACPRQKNINFIKIL